MMTQDEYGLKSDSGGVISAEEYARRAVEFTDGQYRVVNSWRYTGRPTHEHSRCSECGRICRFGYVYEGRFYGPSCWRELRDRLHDRLHGHVRELNACLQDEIRREAAKKEAKQLMAPRLDAIRQRVISEGRATAETVDSVIYDMGVDEFLYFRGELCEVSRVDFSPWA